MAKIVLVCLRDTSPAGAARVQRRLRKFLATLCPDNLTPAEPILRSDGHGLFLGVFNPADASSIHDCSAHVGWLADSQDTWWRDRTPVPSGSFAIFRSSRSAVELLADYAASRTIWFAQNDEMFVASTSQRAIPYLMGSYRPNPGAHAWMLSCGSLGPAQGWDRRAHPLAPAGTARLDRSTWRVTINEPGVQFEIDNAPDEVHERRLANALEETFAQLDYDPASWVVPLSGGFDSRAILLLMRNREGLRTVTWGRKSAPNQLGNDAQVACEVARKLGLQHRYYETDRSNEPVESLLERYLVAGDGRTDGMRAYLDGFRTWRALFDDGVRCIVRGDHGFGAKPRPPLESYTRAMRFVSMTRWSDHESLPSFASFDMPQFDEQSLPASFQANDGEVPDDYRDRLYQLYRVPTFHGGQADLKSAYVEIASPFFVRRVLELTRQHPVHLRTGKLAFCRVMAARGLGIPFAIEPALVTPGAFLDEPAIREVLCDELGSKRARDVFSRAFIDFLLGAWKVPPEKPGPHADRGALRRFVRYWTPKSVMSRLHSGARPKKIDLRWLTLRAYMVTRMNARSAADGNDAEQDNTATLRIISARAN